MLTTLQAGVARAIIAVRRDTCPASAPRADSEAGATAAVADERATTADRRVSGRPLSITLQVTCLASARRAEIVVAAEVCCNQSLMLPTVSATMNLGWPHDEAN